MNNEQLCSYLKENCLGGEHAISGRELARLCTVSENELRRRVNRLRREFGCRITQVQCETTEADITWWDQFEDAVFGPRDKPLEQAGSDEMKMM